MGKKPTVLQVIPQLELGGAEKNAVDCAVAVSQKGWRSLIASNGGSMVEKVENNKCQHFKLPLDARNPITIYKNASRLAKLIKREGVDLIHVHSRSPAWSVKMASKRTGIAFITTYHGAYGQKNSFKRWYNSVMVAGKYVIANSHWTANLVKNRFPDRRLPLEIIEPGTDFTNFNPAKISKSEQDEMLQDWGIKRPKNLVLYLGRLSKAKGAHLLIESAEKILLKYDDTQVIIAGSASKHQDYIETLQQQIDAMELKNPSLKGRVLLVGRCQKPNVALSLADILVVPSLSVETFGLSAVEAQAMGAVPIVANIGGLLETVRGADNKAHSQTGWHFDAGNVASLQGALNEVLQLSSDKREVIAANGREFVLNAYALDRINERLLALYARVIDAAY